MEFRILGPLDVRAGDVPLVLGEPQHRLLLAVLLLEPGRVVPLNDLVDAVWEEDPPATARKQVANRASALRRVFADAGYPGVIVRHHAGYQVDVDGCLLDTKLFVELTDRGDAERRAGRVAEARATLRDALALWRGPFCGGMTSAVLDSAALSWDERRLTALENRLDLELELGCHHDVLGELTALAAEHPLRESIRARLMLALYRCGRQAEALDAYHELRVLLDEQLGVAPGPALEQRHLQILRADPALAAPPPPIRAADPVRWQGAGLTRPAQLPADLPSFAGREEPLRHLTALLPAPGQPPEAVIALLVGTAGVGKTTLAVHWAHRVAERFPDGQLYVNLRGFDPGEQVTSVADALHGFLDALGVPTERMPLTTDAKSALYRSLLADRRVLVVLDNARDAAQVRPLLPGSPGCLTVVTSRNLLTTLVAVDGARPLPLDVLSAAEARDLVTRRLAPRQVDAETAAVDDIVDASARLPLALAVAAARAAVRPDLPLATLAKQLQDSAGSLDPFTAGDAASDLRSVFSWSYRSLGPDAARLFRLLGAGVGPDIAGAAAVSVAGEPAAQVRPGLAELTAAHLLTEHAAGRYTFHDLLRAYAAELAEAADREAERRPAVRRLLDHYLHTACRADALLDPHRDPIAVAAPPPGVVPEPVPDEAGALAWFVTEQTNLVAAIELASREGFDRHAWQLAWALTTFLERRAAWSRQAQVQQLALAAATRSGDRVGQAHAHRCAGRAAARLGRDSLAQEHVRQALHLLESLGDQVGTARAYLNLSWMLARQDRNHDAIDAARHAAERFAAAGHQVGQARALNTMGWYAVQVGRCRFAVDRCQQALHLLAGTNDRHGEADTWDTMGYALAEMGEYDRAVGCYRQAIELYRTTAGRHGEAETLVRLGDACQLAGDFGEARAAWQEALDIHEELGSAAVGPTRDRLAAVSG